jgi:hypothetical protein
MQTVQPGPLSGIYSTRYPESYTSVVTIQQNYEENA